MRRRVFVSTLTLTVGFVAALPVEPALAQLFKRPAVTQPSGPPPQRRGLFDFLFGPPRQQQPIQPAPRSTRPAARAPAVPTVEVEPKDPNATKILVVGDFVAGGLAWGLEQTFASEPRLAVIDRSNGSSGLVRDDFYDWNKALPEFLNEDNPDIVVVMIGANDRQALRDGPDRPQPRTEAWEKAYVARIKGIADTLKLYGQPFFWVGAPPMQSTSASRDMAYLNELYKPLVAEAGGHFVDIWNGFTNENGRYVSSGPDVDGQLRALRNNDGINFTRAGRLKLAFYVEREVRRQTGVGPGSVDLMASTSDASRIEIGPDGKKRMVGPVISLTDASPGASAMLAGAAEPIGDRLVDADHPREPLLSSPGDTESPQYLMIIKGDALPDVAGRADDFAWPPRRKAIVAGPDTVGAISDAAVPPTPIPVLAPRAAAN